jgi:hypothetical protein
MKSFVFCFGIASLSLFLAASAPCSDKVVVHEWGTFTCLQDEQGQAIGGINVDDEPVPEFVHSVAVTIAPQYDHRGWHNLGLPPYEYDKAWISGDPHVTMRLETPVLYLYPPKGRAPASVPPLDVHVDFHGGVLSQFYPQADFSGLPKLRFPGQPQDNLFPYVDKTTGITEQTTTSLDWKGVQLGSNAKPIDTDDKVWTTPRETRAPMLQVKFYGDDTQGWHDIVQAEHFLFYRGVGHLDSPLSEGWSFAGQVGTRTHFVFGKHNVQDAYSEAWLVEIKANGTCAFSQAIDAPSGFSATSFYDGEFNALNLPKLKLSMHGALIKAGLYPDEAAAMLKTWELSYFKSPGLRFFYIVPRAWVDEVLPLKITGAPTEITRVMVGRIELVTAAQRAAIARLAAGPCPDLPAIKAAARAALRNSKFSQAEVDAFDRGEKPLSELGIPIPPLVQDYLSLGRFRDALIVHEQAQHPSVALAQFIKDNQLAPQ